MSAIEGCSLFEVSEEVPLYYHSKCIICTSDSVSVPVQNE